jgi:hypothetical protein
MSDEPFWERPPPSAEGLSHPDEAEKAWAQIVAVVSVALEQRNLPLLEEASKTLENAIAHTARQVVVQAARTGQAEAAVDALNAACATLLDEWRGLRSY